MNDVLVSGFWRARAGSVEASLMMIERFLLELKAADPSLAEWYLKGKTRTEALQKPLRLSELRSVLLAGTNRRDIGGQLLPELGYLLSVWNAAGDSLAIQCGATAAVKAVPFPNRCLLTISGQPSDKANLSQRIVTALISCFSPTIATVNETMPLSTQGVAPYEVPGPITYVASKDSVPPDLRGFRQEPCSTGILLISSVPMNPQSDSFRTLRALLAGLASPEANHVAS